MGPTLAEDHCLGAAGAPPPDSNIVQGGMCGPSLVGASVGYTRCPHWDSNITEGGRAGGGKDRTGRGQGLYTQDMGEALPFAFQAGRMSLGSAPPQECVPPAASDPPRKEISQAHPPDPGPVTTGWEGRGRERKVPEGKSEG